jgi:insulysin
MIIPKFEKRKIEYFKINNIKTVLVNDKNINNSYFAIKVNIGSFHEPEEYKGLAHLLEHMIFMGSHKYPDSSTMMSYIQKNGGSTNAYTSSLETVYYFTIPTIYFNKALDIFSSGINNPLIDEDTVRREINAVNNEHLKNLERDFWRTRQIIFDIFKINKFYTGNKETLDVENIREALIDFHNDYYKNELFNICIISNLNINRQKEMVSKYFSININNNNKSKIPNMNIKNIKNIYNPNMNYHIIPVNNIHQILYCFTFKNNENFFDLLIYNLGSKNKNSLFSYIKKIDDNLLSDITGFLLDEEYKERIFIIMFDLNYIDENAIDIINNSLNFYLENIRNIQNINNIRKVRKFIFNNNIINNIENLGEIFISNLGKYDKKNLYIGNFLFNNNSNNNNMHSNNNIPNKYTTIIVNQEKFKSFKYDKKLKEYYYNSKYYQYTSNIKSNKRLNLDNKNNFFEMNVNLKEPKILKLNNSIVNNNNIWYIGLNTINEPIYFINIVYNIDNYVSGLLLSSIYNEYLEDKFIDYVNLGNNYSFTFDRNINKLILNIRKYNSYNQLEKILDILNNFDPNKLLEKNKKILLKSVSNMKNLNSWEYLDNHYYFPDFENLYENINNINNINNIDFYLYDKIIYGGNINFIDFSKFNINTQKIILNNNNIDNIILKLTKQPCIEILYNSFKFTPKNLLSLQLIIDIFSSDFFDLFRTQKQLGYLVRMSSKEIFYNHYMSQKIQTDYDLDKLEKEIDIFNIEMLNKLKIMDNKEIDKNKKNIKLQLKEMINKKDDISLKYNNYRNTIIKNEYMFDKEIVLLKQLKNINKDSLLEFLENLLKNKIVRKIIR